MNRTLALFLTLAILVAHSLAIHKNLLGAIAPPYDEAHVAFRIARNFVETGSLAWNQGGTPTESYPSLLWVLLAALGERLNYHVTTFCQIASMLCATTAIFVLAQFSPGRLAGVIAPLIFVVSGGVAAAAASGAETAALALLVAASFLAFERRAKLPFAICLSLCVATRAEGIVFALMLLALEIAGSLTRPEKPRVPLLAWFLAPALVVGLLIALRHYIYGTWLSPFAHSWAHQSVSRWRVGFEYLADFVRASGWTLLLVFPLYYLVRGQLRGVGRRALLLSVGYALSVACMGGGHGPMFQPMVPMIALLLIAIQESMTIALDSRRRLWPQVAWAMFLLSLSASALASKYPGPLGMLPLDSLHRRWQERSTPARLSYMDPLGRRGLGEEIDATERLRELGNFMRAWLNPRDRVLTPWPGALGYLSRVNVIDALGRATPPPGEAHPRPWSGEQRIDLLAVLDQMPEYIVPRINWNEWSKGPPTLSQVSDEWSRTLDINPEDPSRVLELAEKLRAYELITVPVPLSRFPMLGFRAPTRPFRLLRRSNLDLAPHLSVEVEGQNYRVLVRHGSYQQLVDLRVVLRGTGGQLWSIQPNGSLREDDTAMLRTSILVFNTSDRSIELASGTLPADLEFVELRAMLRNPLAGSDQHYGRASNTVSFKFAR